GVSYATSVPSGLAAITLSLLSCVEPGDHLLMTDGVYFPARRLCDVFLKRFAVEITYFDPLIGACIAKLFRQSTRAVYLEGPSLSTVIARSASCRRGKASSEDHAGLARGRCE